MWMLLPDISWVVSGALAYVEMPPWCEETQGLIKLGESLCLDREMPGRHGTPLSCDKHCKKNTQLLTETCSQDRAPHRCDLVVHLVSDRLLLSSDWQLHLRAAQPAAEPRALSPGRKHDCMAAAPETARCSSWSVCLPRSFPWTSTGSCHRWLFSYFGHEQKRYSSMYFTYSLRSI